MRRWKTVGCYSFMTNKRWNPLGVKFIRVSNMYMGIKEALNNVI